jgi:hypothetical protein
MSGPAENDLFMRGEPEGVFVVVWKKPPTIEGLDCALGPMVARFKQSPTATQAFLIVSLATEPVATEANRHAAAIARTFAKQFKPLAVVENAGRRRSIVNRVALRMILATAGVFGLGPTVAFFQEPGEGTSWVAKKLRDFGTPVNEQALQQAVARMVEHCSALPGVAG